MDILISIGKRVVEHSVAPIRRELDYLIFVEDNFKELTDQDTVLEGARDVIKHRVEDERRNGKIIETAVQNWLDEVDGVIEEAHKLEKDPCLGKVGCSACLSPNLMLRRWQLSREANKMAKDVIPKLLGRWKFDQVGYLPALYEVGSTSSTRSGEKLESRKTVKEEILQALTDPKVSKIGVYGLGGVGKTTLVKEVAQKAKQDKLFDVVVTATVSQTPDLKRIQGEIADSLSLRFDEETVVGRASRLCRRIKMEKTILIILDDIRTRLDLEQVRIPIGDEHYGCKVLMTSRNQDVLREMEVQKDFRLEVLTDEETWNLFKVMAGDLDKNPNLQLIAFEVAKKCAGLPVLIITVARSLKGQDIHVWKDALNRLARIDNKELHEITYSALELSYSQLQGTEIKVLFLLCAAIVDQPFISDLFKYGMGLGIFTGTNTLEEARNRLHKMISALKASCLLLEDDTSIRIKMHDIVRDVAISIASRDQHMMIKRHIQLKEWPTKEVFDMCPHIFLQECDILELPQRLDYPNIELFYLQSSNRSLKIPGSIFEGTKNLKVLDITYMNLPSLPISFHSLTSLKTLCLDECALENIDEIGAPKNLEILSLIYSSMVKLPSEIGKLTHLRMLDLSNSIIEVIPPNIISSLTKLEELYMGNTFIKWENENSAKQKEQASLAELRHLSNLCALELQIRDVWMLPRDLMFGKLERYKIVIGDVWEWYDIEHVSLKTLKLKLHTNIHLEHGIKALIRGVENLYLDEVDGIENVLYQLNGEGFPLLKHLHIQNHEKMKHIIDSMERSQAQVSFPRLESLVLHNLNNLRMICHGPLAVNSFGSLRAIKVNNCIQLKYLLSFSMLEGLSQLAEMEVCQCDSMKTIIFADGDARTDHGVSMNNITLFSLRSLTLQDLQMLDNFVSANLTSSIIDQKYQRSVTYVSIPLFNDQVAFPNLKTLELSSLNLSKIWGENQYPILKLENLIVENCGVLKYLFTSTMVGSLLNLKWLEISKCHGMEEIIASDKENDSALKEVRFSKLETIILKDMENLKAIWHYQFDTLKTLEVKNCEKIVTCFASSMQGTYNNLETLEITDCALVKELFELTSNAMSSKGETTHLKSITLKRLPKLTQTWSRDPQKIISFHNLQDVCLEACDKLEYLFPLSVAKSCSHLKELIIKFCGLKEIVANKEGSMCSSVLFEFSQLNSIVLWSLHNLKGFYAGNHTLLWPPLKKIDVSNCSKLNLFETRFMSNQESGKDGSLQVSLQQPLFIIEEVISNLKELSLNHKDVIMIVQSQLPRALFINLTFLRISFFKNEDAIFPYWLLENAYSLEWLMVELSSFKEIFQDGRLVSEKICTRLKKLTLNRLPKLQHICKGGSQIDPVLEVLDWLRVNNCSNLINLVPSTVTFSHLKHLKIDNCNGLINLITSTTARSLAKLVTLEIKECNSLEEIIIEKGDETISDITFMSLENLKLEHLPRLKRFSSSACSLRFPLLENMVVRQCPRMEIFSDRNTSTPNLRKVHIVENNEEWYWKEDLNCTIKNMFENKVMFRSFNHLKLSEYPELKEVWHAQFQQNVFSNLKYLMVYKCEFLSDVLFQPNVLEVLIHLEELDVRDCASLEAVFDVKSEFDEEIMVKKSTQLKKLSLSGLPKLKHVWKEDPHRCLSFQNLSEVFVMECKSLKGLFPLSVARDIIRLQVLKVYSCGIEEIVTKEEGLEEIIKFVFPRLTSIALWDLPELKGFYTGTHTLHCKALEMIDVFDCQKLKVFKTEPISCQGRVVDCKHYVSMHQPLLTIERVLPNLEKLTLNEDVVMILQSLNLGEQFSKLKCIRASEFANKEATFPYWFLKSAPNLESLVVQCSSFTEIFQDEQLAGEEGGIKTSPRVKDLTLIGLHELQHICKEGYQIDPILQLLERIYVGQCSSLINLVPSPVTLTYLTKLEVANCDGLVNLITCSTAKSLVNLTTMKIKACKLLEDVVAGKEVETSNEIAFCNLEILELVSLPRLRRFCSRQCFIKFPLLEEMVVKECPRMEMFSLGIISTPNLTRVQIKENNKEYRWEGELEGTIKMMFMDMVPFHSFKHLDLSEYPELRDLWCGKHMHKIFCNLKSLVVQKCDFLSDILFASNLLQLLQTLEELEVKDCDSLEAVFDVRSKFDEDIMVKKSTQLKKLSLSGLPKLKHVWKEDPHRCLSFQNLSEVSVVQCKSLKSLFPLSVATDIIQLQVLELKSCGIEEIVTKEEGLEEIIKFVFPRLTSIALWDLPELKGFSTGTHTLHCKSLKEIDLFNCLKLKLFETEPISCQGRVVDCKHYVSMHQPLFTIERVSPNLEELALNGNDAMRMINSRFLEHAFHNVKLLRLESFHETPMNFLSDFPEVFPNLVTFHMRSSSFETLFPLKGIGHCNKGIPKHMRVLWLFQLEQLKHIWDEDSPLHLLQNLEGLDVWSCPRLITLVPYSIPLKNLTYLNVRVCKGLIYVITSSTAKSLVQLKYLRIENCEMMEDVIKVDDEQKERIIFENLEYLNLISLSSLRSFCSGKYTLILPSLTRLEIKGCPKMKIFALGDIISPLLKAVEAENRRKWWKGDLNSTVQHLFIDKVAFHSFKHLNLSEYPELRDLWYGKQMHKIFRNLKSVVVQKCDFLSNILFPPNLQQLLRTLEELEVKDCDSLEAVFDMKGMDDNERMVKETSSLRKLTLSGLPKLKYIWNKDSQDIISFGDLRIVTVVKCQSLEYLFSLSVCHELGQLEELNIGSCAIKEIVAMDERSAESCFDFPLLTTLRLLDLPNLKSFYPRRHTLECPSLKMLHIYHCKVLQLFSFDHSDFQQALFSTQAVSPNLEELALNGNDAMRMINSRFLEHAFHNVKLLRLESFHETPMNFLSDFLAVFPNLVTLHVRSSSFETLFPLKGIGHCNKGIRVLWLFQLEQLKHIWDEDSPLHLLQNLEGLDVWSCPRLITLVPYSIPLKNLTYLNVRVCKGLIYVITSSTAKSLVQLKYLRIENCEMMEDVIKDDDEQKEGIIFENLEYLNLISLSSLTSFCSGKYTLILPSLARLEIKGCPKMKIFALGDIISPLLTAVEAEDGRKWWKGDLNSTVQHLFIDKMKDGEEEEEEEDDGDDDEEYDDDDDEEDDGDDDEGYDDDDYEEEDDKQKKKQEPRRRR